jgi:hypothetical protein
MTRSKSDISNSAIRIFLQDVGKFYDSERGYAPFSPNVKQRLQLLEYFNNRCCFCNIEICQKTMSQDHLIPMNKTSLGLHAWGNVVPCCKPCNNEKNQTNWRDFMASKASPADAMERIKLIDKFVVDMDYDPTLDLHKFADTLYEDVGAVATTLINLRYRQAENAIKKLHTKNNSQA